MASSDDESPSGPPRVIVVIENACLETVKVGKKFELMNCDDHHHIMQRAGRDPKNARPDITHHLLLTLLDSPLNKAGKLKIYIHTQKNVCIDVNPHIRIPRTYKRFAGLMVQLLHKLSIRASNGPDKLLRVVKNPITRHFPVGAHKIGTSFSAKKCIRLQEFIPTLPMGVEHVWVLGGMAHGAIDVDYLDETIAFSEYPLSANVAAAKLTTAYEELFNVL